MAKICTKCGRELPETEEYFYKQKGYKNNLTAICRDCISAYGKKHRRKNVEKERMRTHKWYVENKERAQQRYKQYCVDNKEKLRQKYLREAENNRERARLYYINNRERVEQYKKDNAEVMRKKRIAYREEHKDKLYERTREWFNKHPGKRCEYEQKRQARKRMLVFNYTAEMWENCKEYFENKCAYCGREKTLLQEHFIPLSKGGEYTSDNILPTCGRCNNKKYNKDFNEWYPEQDFYSKESEDKIMEYFNSIMIYSSTS